MSSMIRKRKPWDLGTWVWLLNRIAGVIIVVYLIIHIFVISASRGDKGAFDSMMRSLHNPFVLFLELLLIVAVLAHGLNGLRHILIDFGLTVPEKHKVLFFGAAAVCAAFFLSALFALAAS